MVRVRLSWAIIDIGMTSVAASIVFAYYLGNAAHMNNVFEDLTLLAYLLLTIGVVCLSMALMFTFANTHAQKRFPRLFARILAIIVTVLLCCCTIAFLLSELPIARASHGHVSSHALLSVPLDVPMTILSVIAGVVVIVVGIWSLRVAPGNM